MKNIIIHFYITCQFGWREGELAASLLESFLLKPSISVKLHPEKKEREDKFIQSKDERRINAW